MKRKTLYFSFILTLVFAVSSVYAEDTLLVSGIITGIRNHPVSNVSVSVEGVISVPEISDEEGRFSISVPGKNATLIITPPGAYKSQSIFLGKRTNIALRLTSSDIPGNRDQTKNIFTYVEKRQFNSPISLLSEDKLYLSDEQTIDRYIEGNIAGAWGIGLSGRPGSGSAIFIRGIHSMNANSQPLYVVDGLPIEQHGNMDSFADGFSFNPLSGLNPADITDMTVIKDNASTSLYGVRGSNGLILIETLKPTEVQTAIDFRFRTGFSSSPSEIPQLNSDQYRTYAKELLMTSEIPEENYPLLYPGLYVSESDNMHYKYNNNTNWQSLIFRDALMYDVYFRILGGDEIAKYGLSVGYQNNEGIIEDTNFDRFSVRFVGSFNMAKWLKLNVSSNLSSTVSSLKESARVSQTSPVYTALLKNPLMIPYQFDNDGNQLAAIEEVDELGVSNPLGVISGFSANNKNYSFLTTFRIEAELTSKLRLKSNIGINFNSLSEEMFMPNNGMELYYNDEAWNASKSMANYLYAFTNDNFLNYKTRIGNSHVIEANGGFRINSNKFQSDWGIAKNSHENDEYTTLQSGTANIREMGGMNGNWNRLAVYGNFNYTFREKYSADLNISAENSTRIGPMADNVISISDVPFGVFYGTGLSWRISNEAFFDNINWIDDLKLRFSYGKSGNDNIGNYNAFNYFSLVHYRNTTGLIPSPMTDESLTFEEHLHMNSGLDFTTWGNRFTASIDYYRNRTKNLLIYEKQESYLGHQFLPVNDGEIENRGWDFDLFTRVIKTQKFFVDIGFNVSHSLNKVLQLEAQEIITPFMGGEFITRVEENMLNFYGYRYLGVFASASDASDANLVNRDGIAFGAGDAIFEDISGPSGEMDGVIDDYDKTIIGSALPEFYGGFSTHINYDKWHLNILFQGVYGNEVFNYMRSVNEGVSELVNQSSAVLNRWQYEGQETNVPRSLWSDPVGNSSFSSRWIEDGSYLRLKNISLSYKIPGHFLVFRNAEFYVTGTNLVTFSGYLGYDPEFAISYQTMEQGIDYGMSPHTRTYMIGVKLGL